MKLYNEHMCKIFSPSGDNCELEVDGCLSRPCTEGQECTNLKPDEEEDNERRYKCGTCPPGYHDGGAVCVGELANQSSSYLVAPV